MQKFKFYLQMDKLMFKKLEVKSLTIENCQSLDGQDSGPETLL